MPEGLPGDQPQICACPGCDEVVVQSDPGNTRLYHSAECRRKARRLRHDGHAEQPTAAAAAADPGPAAPEPAPAAPPFPAELPATAKASASAADPGTAAGQPTKDADTGSDDSEFWHPDPGEADGFWDADDDQNHKSPRSPGRHRSAVSQRARPKRSHAAAIAVTLAASVVGLGLIFTQSGPDRPLATDVQLHPPAPITSRPASGSSSAPARHARTHDTARHAGGGASHAPTPPATSPAPPSTHPPAPTPTPTRTSSPPSPSPTHSRRQTHPVPHGLISFEDGTDGWKPFFGSIRPVQSARVAYSGSHSLLITARSTYSAVGVDNKSVAHLQPGDTVTFHIWSDGQSGGSVLPFAELFPHPEDLADNVALPTHPGWFTLTWTVPSVPHVEAIGIQVVHHGRGRLKLAIDGLSWTGS